MVAGFPVVNWLYRTVAEIPIPCCPLVAESLWNLEPYNNLAKILGICFLTIPGPLSSTIMRNRVSLNWISSTLTSGRILASSQASKALSTASLTAVSSALRGLSNPNRCRFFSKNSAIEISRCFLASSSALFWVMISEGDRVFLKIAVDYLLIPALGSYPAACCVTQRGVRNSV